MTGDLDVVVPFAATLALRVAAPDLGSRLPPRAAARLLTGGALVSAVTCVFVLVVVAFDALAQLPSLAAAGHWSAAAVHRSVPLPPAAGWPVALLVLALLVAALARLVAVGRDLHAGQGVCRALGPGASGLVVVEDDRPDAYTVPGWRGRIVVSTAMLAALPAPERRVLLAHEHCHLRHRHHLYVQLGGLAAAANPLLRPLVPAVELAVERWADEQAAADVGDRRTAAQALARASLASRRAASASSWLGAVRTSAGERVRALLAPPPPRRLVLRLLVLVLIVTSAGSALDVGHDTEVQFRAARSASPGPL